MKLYVILTLSLLTFLACRHSGTALVGHWKVHSQFYQSTCQIYEDGRYLKGLILSYHDGTSTYHHAEESQRFLFENLKEKDGVYVDGISGATTMADDETPLLSIELKSKDSLLVTTYIMNQPQTELWTRLP